MYDITIVGHDAHIVPQSQQEFTLTPCWGVGVQPIEWFVKNSKTRYLKATLSSTLEYVTLGNGITFTQAVKEVKAKKSVFCIFKSDDRQVARRASKELYGIDGYYSDDPHCKLKRFAYKHYHVYKHKNGAHIWYLFD